MNKKKKTRILIRILCGILAVIMTLSVVMPAVYAAEIDESAVNTAPYRDGEGFEYIEMDGEWYLNATSENPVFRLTNVSDSFTRDNLPILIANLDTYEVQVLNLLGITGYAASAQLKEGYYLIYTGNYAWEDDQGTPWALNNGYSIYFYVGDLANYDATKYDLDYVIPENHIIDIPLIRYTDTHMTAIKSTTVFHLTGQDAIYPVNEIYNWDEILTRMEHIDLEATLEEGQVIYRDGYTPNSLPATDESDANNQPNNNNLGELAAAAAPDSVVVPTDEIPIAQPEVITPPVSTQEEGNALSQIISGQNNEQTTQNNQSATTVDTPQESVPDVAPTEREQSELEKTADDLLNQAYDVLGVGEKDEATRRKEAIGRWIRNGLMVAALVVVIIFYLKEKKKNEEALAESLENNKYFDGHIE